MTARKITAGDMLTALYRHFNGSWAMLTEVTARPEPQPINHGQPWAPGPRQRDRRIDVLLVRPDRRARPAAPNPSHLPAPTANTPPGLFPPPDAGPALSVSPQGDEGPAIERLAIEVKVTRADFLSDVRNPQKQAPWRALAHRHAFAVPAGLVREDEVPAGSGLIEVTFSNNTEWSTVKFTRRAPRCDHDPGPLPLANIMDAFWRTSRMEAQTKGYGLRRDEVGDDPAELRALVARLQRELGVATGERDRYADRCRDWQKRWSAHVPPACGTCGQHLHIPRKGGGRFGLEWEHRDPVEAKECLVLRTAAAAAELHDLPDGHIRKRLSVHVPDPQPRDLVELEVAS